MPIPLPVIPRTFRCALHWVTSSGLTAVNVIHIELNAGVATNRQVMDLLDAHVTAAMWNMVGSNWSVNKVTITPLDGVTASSDFVPATPAHWAGNTGGDVAPQVSGVMKLQTASRGPRFRGRVFLPSPAEGQTTAGKLNDGTEVSASTAWTAFQTALQADATKPSSLVVASYDRAHAGAGAVATTVVTISGEQTLATQRRRQSRLRI